MQVHLLDDRVERFIQSLEYTTYGKILHAFELLETYGYRLGMPHAKQVKKHLFELRISGQQETRLFYTIQTSKAIIIHGFVKKTMQTPRKELHTALSRLRSIAEK